MKILHWFTPLRMKLLLVVAPIALTTAYLTLFATERYVSESTVALRDGGGAAASPLPGAALLLANIATPSREDTLYLKQYIQSIVMMQKLDERFALRAHFGAPVLDLLYRLPEGASQEDFLDYFRSRVTVSMDELSSTLTVRVQGFAPEFAQQVNRAILDECERFVNEVSHKIARERLAFAETELKTAGERLQQAKAQLLTFQGRHQLLDPTAEAEAAGSVIAGLNAQISAAEAELRALRAYLQDDAYPVKSLRSQIAGLQDQVLAERKRATGGGKAGARINALAVEYQGLQMQAEFALDAYRLGLSAVENGRIDASRKLKNLIVIEPPSLPETAAYPRRLYNVATLLAIVLVLYGALSLALATIREHQD